MADEEFFCSPGFFVDVVLLGVLVVVVLLEVPAVVVFVVVVIVFCVGGVFSLSL